MTVEEEYKRLHDIYASIADEKLMQIVDGALIEAARIRVELESLQKLAKASGLVCYDPNNPANQKALPVVKTLVQVRASYINYISKLARVLGKPDDDEMDEALDEYM